MTRRPTRQAAGDALHRLIIAAIASICAFSLAWLAADTIAPRAHIEGN